jgi:hypothetical protein
LPAEIETPDEPAERGLSAAEGDTKMEPQAVLNAMLRSDHCSDQEHQSDNAQWNEYVRIHTARPRADLEAWQATYGECGGMQARVVANMLALRS